MSDQTLIYHGLVSRFSTLSVDLRIMREAGFQGLEISAAKMRDVLASGFSEAELTDRLKHVFIPGIGFLLDIERNGPDEAQLLSEARDMFRLARIAGARGAQVLTGPVQIDAVRAYAEGRTVELYQGTLALPRDKQMEAAAGNLALLADLAAESGLLLYLEALAWVPLNRLRDQVELIRRANRPNLRLVVDFWHCYASGDTPQDVADLPLDLIYGVHVCDSLTHSGGLPDENVLRNVPTGSGVLPLKEWCDAVKATGYKGWWSCELFCRRQQQDDSFAVAGDLHRLMSDLIL